MWLVSDFLVINLVSISYETNIFITLILIDLTGTVDLCTLSADSKSFN